MAELGHIFKFLLAAAVIWFFAGLLVSAVDRVARRFHQSGFTVAFFVLGLLTSISEISVMVNSTIDAVPQVSAGNLAGASFVLIALVIPLLAAAGGGVALRSTMSRENLALVLLVTASPSLLILDGRLSLWDSILLIMLYALLLYRIQGSAQKVPVRRTEAALKQGSVTLDALKIIAGGACIFLAGHILVEEAVYFSEVLSVPSSIIGLLVLSVGTNVPEIVVAVRSIMARHKDIALGDYLGSAVTNTAIMGVLGILHRGFSVESSEFFGTAILTALAFTLFYRFATSGGSISRREGLILISAYAFFFLLQTYNLIRFATD